MPNVILSPQAFAEATEELAKRTGRSLGEIAAGLAASGVKVEAPPPDFSRFRLRDYSAAIARATAEHQCSISQAIQLVNMEDFFDGLR